jgi:hypothetical protein
MKTTKPNWNVKKLQRMSNAGELRFDYPIQRASGQWDALQKSLLIHSIVGDYPVPPIAIVKANVDGTDGEFVIDGKQRSTTTLDFISGIKDEEGNYPASAYPLHEETPTVEIEGLGEIEIAGKYFDELHADAQAEILSSNFQIQRMEDATDEQIEELFGRWNNGTPLSKQQKARGKMGTANAVIIDKLLKHNFIQEKASFTALQRRRSDDEAVIIQTMMLMSDYEIPSNGFVADNILKFASDMRDTDITEVTKAVTEALDYADTAIDSKHVLLKKLHLPTILVMAKKAHDEKIEADVFGAWIEDFNNAINGRTRDKALVKTNYKNYTGAGSVKKDKVTGRMTTMTTHFNEFVDRYEPVIVEPTDESKEEPKAKPEPMFTDADVEADKAKAEAKKETKAKKTEKKAEQKADEKADDLDTVFAGLDEVLTK